MKNCFLIFCTFLLLIAVQAQPVTTRLAKAFQRFESDGQMRNAIASLYVVDVNAGTIVFEKNASFGLTPASTQKVITSASAYELLKKDFRYKTEILFSGTKNVSLIIIQPSGDPTFGSWRWAETKESAVLENILKAIRSQSIKNVKTIVIDLKGWESESIPDGWIWQDLGNYYGAGSEALNWRENQYDLILKSGATLGSPVVIVGSNPKLYEYQLTSLLTSASKGSGDQAYIYFPLHGGSGVVRGTIPVNENHFIISGSFPSAKVQFAGTLKDELKEDGKATDADVLFVDNNTDAVTDNRDLIKLYTHSSPSLDSIIYWLNRKSINLYAEAMIKAIAYRRTGLGSTEKGIELVKKHWQQKDVPGTELNMVDGSGLSPLNRVTTKAMVNILQYAQKQPWFDGFYHSLPEFNNMKMKSGTINGVKGFAGYHHSKAGATYAFAFIVNNYNGSSASLVQKMYEVLNELK